jgi:hypothetical protein
MKLHTIAAFTAAILMLALIAVPAVACAPQCGPGEELQIVVPGHYEWGPCQTCPFIYFCHHGPDYRHCGPPHEQNWHEQHRYYVDPVYGCVAVTCPAIPCEEGFECVDGVCTEIPPAPVEQSTGFYAFTAGPCTAPARVINLSEKDGRTYLVRASYMGFVDNLTISTYYEAGDSDRPYYQLNPFITSTSGVGVVALSSGGAVAKSFEYSAVKDETSTPSGWQITGELMDMSTGAVVDTQSTEGADTCLHVLYNLAPSH